MSNLSNIGAHGIREGIKLLLNLNFIIERN